MVGLAKLKFDYYISLTRLQFMQKSYQRIRAMFFPFFKINRYSVTVNICLIFANNSTH